MLCFAVNGLCALTGVVDGVQGNYWAALRLCAGSIGGWSLVRSRRRPLSKATLAFHCALAVEVGVRVKDDLWPRKPAGPLTGRDVGYDDDRDVGWAPDLEDLSADEVRRRHLGLVEDFEVATDARDERAKRSFCWRENGNLQCVPEVYLIGMPKCGTSELWESLVQHPSVVKARRKETRFFTRGEFAGLREGGLDAKTRLDAFAKEHTDASRVIDREIDAIGTSSQILVDGGPHTLWWSTQAYDGTDTGMAPVPQLLHALVPRAKLIATLAEPGKRTYSDYWFITEKGVVRPPRKGREEVDMPVQSVDDFHAKMTVDARALELCFNRFAGDHKRGKYGWPLRAVQRCAYDRFHFGRNGRGRLGAGLYAAFLGRWLELFERDRIVVVRLEDHGDRAVWDFLGLEPPHMEDKQFVVNGARRARPPMRADTAALLRSFFAPHNARLVKLLGDDRFEWRDARPNEWFNVTGRAEPDKKKREPKDEKRKKKDEHLEKKFVRRHDLSPGENYAPPPKQEHKHEELPEGIKDRLASHKDASSPETAIMRLAAQGDATQLSMALSEQTVDDRYFHEAVILAALRADVDVMRTLVNASMSSVATARGGSRDGGDLGFTALHVACLTACWGDSMRGSLVFRVLEGDASPVDQALLYGATESGQRLLDERFSTRGRDNVASIEIRDAMAPAVADTVRALIAAGVPPAVRDDKGRTAAHYCAQGGFADALDRLLVADASVVDAAEDVHGATPAHMAALWGQPETLEQLVAEHHADIWVADKHGHTVHEVATGPGAAVGQFLATHGRLARALGNATAPARAKTPRQLGDNHGGGWRPASAADRDALAGPDADADYCDFAIADGATVSGEELWDKYVSQNRPVLVRGILDDATWDAARQAYTVDELLRDHGGAAVTVSAIPYARKFASGLGARGETLKDYVRHMFNDTDASPDEAKYPWYVFRGHPVKNMPADKEEDWFVPSDIVYPPQSILDAFDTASDYATPRSTRIQSGGWKDRFWPFVNVQWALGVAGSGAPMHFHNSAWNACIYGAKRWIAYPPAFNVMSNDQIRLWDETVRPVQEPPVGTQPRPLECIQRKGDVAIIPELWGHGVLNLQDTLAVAIEVKGSLFRAPLPKAYKRVMSFHDHRKGSRS